MPLRQIKTVSLIALIIMAWGLTASNLLGQSEKGTIKGHVTVEGSPREGVEIAVKKRGCTCDDCKNDPKCDCCPDQFTARSGQSGSFQFSVEPGTYVVVARNEKSASITVKVAARETKEVTIEIK